MILTAAGKQDGAALDRPRVKTLAGLLQELRRIAPVWEDLVRYRVIETTVKGGTIVFEQHATRSPAVREMAGFLNAVWQDGGVTAVEEVYVTSHLVAEGPKVFRPSAAECEALENVDPRVSVSEYAQPFPTMAVELPGAYRARQAVPMLDTRTGREDQAFPVAVILRHEPGLPALFTSVLWSGGLSVVRALHHFGGLATIADILHAGEPPPGGSMPVSEREQWLTDRIACVAVNAMLLLTQYGHQRLGRDSESYAARLERHLKLAQKRRGDTTRPARELRLLPVVYGFAQTVTLCDRQGALPAGDGTGVGSWTVAPHWRRGHFRMQPVGPGRTERRLTFIRPVLVHREKLRGTEARTSATYLSDPEDARAGRQEERRRQAAADSALEIAAAQKRLEDHP